MRMYMLALPAFVLGGVVLLAHLLLAGRSARTFWVGWGFILVGLLALVTSLVARGLQPATPRLPLTTMFEITVLVQMGAAGTLLVVPGQGAPVSRPLCSRWLRRYGPTVTASTVLPSRTRAGTEECMAPDPRGHRRAQLWSLFMSGVTAAMATVI